MYYDNCKTMVIKDEVRNRYKQYLSCDRRRIHITTPEFFHEKTLKIFLNSTISSVLVPLDSITYQTLYNIENFFMSNIESPKYKPLSLKEAMYVNVSKWCKYVRIHENGSSTPMDSGTTLGKGFYLMVIYPSHVYIREHRGKETSLSIHIIKIFHKEDEDIDLIECLNSDTASPPPTPAPTSATPALAPKPMVSTTVPAKAAAALKRKPRARKHDTHPSIFAGAVF